MADCEDRSQGLGQTSDQASREAASRFDAPDLFVLAIHSDGRIIHLSDAWESVFGSSAASLVGSSIQNVLDSAGIDVVDATEPEGVAKADARGLLDVARTDLVLRCHDEASNGRVLQGQVFSGLEDPTARLLILRDETAKWEALAQLDRNERRFRVVADASQNVLSETDIEGRFVYVSDACETVLGYTANELVGTSALNLHPPEYADAFLEQLRAVAKTGEPFKVGPHRLRRSDGSLIWAEAMGITYHDAAGKAEIVGVARDVTDQVEADSVKRSMDARVLRGQKLESLGVLAGGIAHDFNNLLTPIIGNVGLALLDLPDGSPVRKRIEMIKTAANRATSLTRQILAYAGQGIPTVEPVSISSTIEEMQLLLKSSASKSTKISYELSNQVPLIEVDRTHVGQLVMNLVANASESFGGEEGEVEVKTGLVHADQGYLDACFIGENLKKGEYVYLEVSDSGSGMAPDLLARIFEPFFTTRFIGRGLGLTAVDGIVRGYYGGLELMSVEGQGTRIRVLFPTLPSVASASLGNTSTHVASFNKDAPERRGTILVVDDDENTCELMTTVLDRADFRVIQASGGAAAVKFYERHMDDIDGVVLDYTMPLISGAEVFDSIRSMRPDARIILVSGYAQARAAEDLMGRGLYGFLQKPFTPEDLVREAERMFAEVTAE